MTNAFYRRAARSAYRPGPSAPRARVSPPDRSRRCERPATDPSARPGGAGTRYVIVEDSPRSPCATAIRKSPCHASKAPSPAMHMTCSSGRARATPMARRCRIPWAKSQRWQKSLPGRRRYPTGVKKCRYPSAHIVALGAARGPVRASAQAGSRFPACGVPGNAALAPHFFAHPPTKCGGRLQFRALTNARPGVVIRAT